MKNSTGNKLDKLIFGMFDQMIEGVDQYNHSGSLWLIFTDERQWVIEYTEGGTLWYNYKLFKSEMELVALDCVENKEYITRWFEDRFLNKPKVDETWDNSANMYFHIENTIQNGVKNTKTLNLKIEESVEDTIQNGVNITAPTTRIGPIEVEDAIQNGVKKTLGERMNRDYSVKDIVENGIKNTYSDILPQEYDMSNQFDVEDTIENGVKETELKSGRQTGKVEDTIQNGVKRTRSGNFFNTIERIEDTIENGEKIK